MIEFWKGRQRLNRLYRWIANVVRPKIDCWILSEVDFQNNPDGRVFSTVAGRDVAPRDNSLSRGESLVVGIRYRRRNWPRGGAPRGAPPVPGRSSLWRKISRPFSRS